MKSLSLSEMEVLTGEGWLKCAAGLVGGAAVGFASSTGNGVALVLGPVAVTWGAIGAIGGALVGGVEGGCFD
ncbi:MAG: ComC/BlpC family peptide pheromone/bacteriocin [Cyclobacteriaceae bacterium]|nr:MAG: ComC/BlpC family peptide pheromone/bacteriocin [Cyclobacteriaceae bacterium]